MESNVSLQSQLQQENVLKNILSRFDGDIEVANKFRNTLISIAVNNSNLQKCSAQSILRAAFSAVELNLSINPNLGYVYFVPYGDKAQLQIGWKGLYRLAVRSGKYITLRAITIYEGIFKHYNFVTGEYRLGEKISDKIEGYFAYFELNNGFKHNIYKTEEQMRRHAEKYSKSYQYDLQYNKRSSIWSTNFEAMAQKTILRELITKYGPMSSDMEKAISISEHFTDWQDEDNF